MAARTPSECSRSGSSAQLNQQNSKYYPADFLFFTFGNVLKAGQQHVLQEEDAIDLLQSELPQTTSDLLRAAWDRRFADGRPSVVWSIWDSYKGMLLFTGIIHVFDIGLLFVAPPLIGILISHIESGDANVTTGLLCAVGLTVCPIVQLLASNNFEIHTRRLGMRCMGGMGCMVFEKIVRLSQSSSVQYGPGKLANIMQVDTMRFSDTFFFVHFLWSMPMMLFMACAMTYQRLGLASIAPLIIMGSMYPLNKLLTKRLMKLSSEISKARDARVKVLTEVLHAVRLCKMLGWEHQITNLVEEKRSAEMSIIGRFKYWQVLIALIWGGGTAAILQLSTFALFVLLGGELSPALVFSSLSLFDLLQVPMNLFPITFQYLVQMQVGIRRIEKLLLQNEVQFTPLSAVQANAAEDRLYVRCPRKEEDDRAKIPVRLSSVGFKWAEAPEECDSDSEDEGMGKRCMRFIRRSSTAQRDARAPLLADPSGISIAEVPRHVTLNVPMIEVMKGKLVFVCGPVGSGKSTLMAGMLGECPQVKGRVDVLGSVAYCAQVPWILHGTVLDNILFGQGQDPARFKAVVKACALEADFEQLRNGEKTIIGERGINLSGGQKARIGLARAAYAGASVYLFDDPLSAVDAHVAAHLVKECLGSTQGFLKDTTRILATHQVQFLNHADVLVLVRDGEVVAARSPSAYSADELDAAGLNMHGHGPTNSEPVTTAPLTPQGDAGHHPLAPPALLRTLSKNSAAEAPLSSSNVAGMESCCPFRLPFDENSADDVIQLGESKLGPVRDRPRLIRSTSAETRRPRPPPQLSRAITEPVRAGGEATALRLDSDLGPGFGTGDATVPEVIAEEGESAADLEAGEVEESGDEHREQEEEEEDRVEGALSTRVWCTFIRTMGSGFVLVVFCLVATTCCTLGSTLWLANWSHNPDGVPVWIGLIVYSGFSFGVLIFIAGRLLVFRRASLAVSVTMHRQALWAVLRSPMSWLDTTPSGRLVNRFSQDLQRVDMELQMNVLGLFRSFADLFTSVLVVTLIVPVLLLIFVPTLLLYGRVQKIYRASSRELQRLASKTKSPIFQGLDEAIVGVATIRAFRKEQHFYSKNAARVRRNLRLEFTRMGCQRWLGVRLRMLGTCISASLAVFIVVHSYLGPLGRAVSGAVAGVALRYSQSLSGAMEAILNTLTTVEQCLIAVERLTTVKELTPEAELVEAQDESLVQWPSRGEIVFEEVHMRYRADLEPVLKGMSFAIPGGTSVGVVGRTGAGKSSCLQALFRMCPLDSGCVKIDGVDISKVGLHTLRRRLAIIPQDPVGFTGTVRFNLDPFGEHDDAALWRDLGKVQLKTFFESKEDGLGYQLTAGGENLSVGQRQLLCAARAFLRGCLILVLDEATASVDFQTDALIQEVLSNEVTTRKLTTLTIAHRINTILGADRVLVVAGGIAAEFGPTKTLAEDPSSMFYTFVNPATKKD